MKIIITYKSKTGFAKKYAEMIAKETGCRALPLKEMTVEKCRSLIWLSLVEESMPVI